MPRTSWRSALRGPAAALFCCALPGALSAALVSPGQTIRYDHGGAIPTVDGTVLAEVTQSLSLSFDTPGGATLRETTITSQVVQEDGTDGLTFVYALGVTGDEPAPSERAVVWHFTGLSTDVLATSGGDGAADVTRAADGSSLAIDRVEPGAAAGVVAVVRTNATAYDDSGTALYRLTQELPVGGEGSSSDEFTASASAFGLLQPATGATPPPVVIPLAPAVVPATLTLAGVALVARARRARRRRIA